MSATALRRLAWVVFGVIALGTVGAGIISLLIAGGGRETWSKGLQDALFLVALFSFAVVGVLIASQQPRNIIGWILLGSGLSWAVIVGAEAYAHYGFDTNPGSLPRPDLAVVLTSSLWVPAVGLMGTFLILLFPNGRLPSRGWRPLAWLSAIVMVLLMVGSPLLPGSLPEITAEPSWPDVANPLGIEALSPLGGPLDAATGLLPLCMVGSALSAIGRFRRSRERERLQLKWLAAGAGLTATLYLIFMAFGWAEYSGLWTSPAWVDFYDDVTIYSFALIPVAVGIAILKHRLYDIDLIINRTLVYGALTALLVFVYVAGVVGLGGALRELANQENNNLAVAASTLAVAALFRPARGRIQGFIDRRFYRRKYDAAQTLEAFSARLRDEVDLDELSSDLLTAIKETMQPAHASLWLRPGVER
jgi:hypothetical protein